jgi:CBS domain containing-hemolysin-like protein
LLTAVLLVAALALVLLNGFFVAAEFSLARSRTTRLEHEAEAGSATATLARQQVASIDRYLAACQLGITIASLALGWIGEPAFGHLLEPFFEWLGIGAATSVLTAGIIAFVIITGLHVVVGELAPKSIAIQRPERTALSIARPLEWFRWLFSPLVHVLNSAGNALVRALGVEPAKPSDLASTPEDIQRLVGEGEEGGNIEPEQADMVEGVFGLGDGQTREIMTPRPEVTTLLGGMGVREGLAAALDTRHSRFPVVDEEDNVLGVVHISDLSRGLLSENSVSVSDVAREALFVPETQPVDELLHVLKDRHRSMAVALDEYGELAGVVTVEDVIEEIVGEIDDERDRASSVETQPDGRLLVHGFVPLEDLRDHDVEIEDDTVTSVGGLIFTRLGRVPEVDDSVVVDGYRLTVQATRGTRVVLVAIEEEEPPADGDAPAATSNRRSNGSAP